jgi:hypothetical protein
MHQSERAAFIGYSLAPEGREKKLLFFSMMKAISKLAYEINYLHKGFGGNLAA